MRPFEIVPCLTWVKVAAAAVAAAEGLVMRMVSITYMYVHLFFVIVLCVKYLGKTRSVRALCPTSCL